MAALDHLLVERDGDGTRRFSAGAIRAGSHKLQDHALGHRVQAAHQVGSHDEAALEDLHGTWHGTQHDGIVVEALCSAVHSDPHGL